MSLLFTEQFKKQYGAKASVSLAQTKVHATAEVSLPKESVVHHIPLTATENGFRGNNPLIISWPNNVRVHFVEDFIFRHGKTRKATFNPNTFSKTYFRSQPSLKRSRDIDRSLMATNDLLILDYTMLTRKVQYTQTKTVYQDYWANLADAVLEKNKTVSSFRTQFLQLHVPNTFVEEAKFKTSIDELDGTGLTVFRDSALLWFLEIYRFLSHSESLVENLDDDFIFVITMGLKSVYLPVGVLRDIADTQSGAPRQFHDLLEKMFSYQTVVDNDAKTPTKEVSGGGNLSPRMNKRLDDLMASGQMTTSERNRINAIASEVDDLPSPFNPDVSLREFGEIKEEELTIPKTTDSQVVEGSVPEGAEQSTVTNFRKGYVDGLMQKDIVNALTGLSNGGVFLRGLEITEESDALETTQMLHITLAPIDGKETTFVLEMPTFNSDGTFSIHGVNYTMDAQKTDIPLRKITGIKAAITTYIDKIFISRSELVKHNYSKWLFNSIGAIGLSEKDDRVVNIAYGKNSIPARTLPRDYTSLMVGLESFDSGSYHFDFNYGMRMERYGKDVVRKLEGKDSVVCGKVKSDIMVMSKDGRISVGEKDIGNIIEILGGRFGKVPRDVAVFNSVNRSIPVVFFLGYFLGMDGLVRKLKAKVRYEPISNRSTATDDEIALNFKDERMLINVSNPIHSLIFSGLMEIQKELSVYTTSDFNRESGWKDVLPYLKANIGHIKEWELKEQLFVDPISKEILVTMKEPTELIELFIRCVDLIKTDESPDENDPKFMRIRGMERVAGLLYKTMYQAIREQRNQPNSRNVGISLPPTIIKEKLHQDGSVQLVSEINPIHNLKEQEAVTLSGEGGRSARTLVKRHRAFHDNDLGLLSEHTPDSSKVGIRGFMPPNAKLDNLRGAIGSYDPATDNSTSLLSTSALIMPEMDRDDGKRMNLAAVQQSAVVPITHNEPAPYQTAYGGVIASRVSDFYVFVAKEDGVVLSVNDKVIKVQYSDGSKAGYGLGVKHGKVAGDIIPHIIVTDFKKGMTFKKGYVLAWNKGFFTRDFFNKYNVIYSSGTQATVALMEGNDVLEDGSAISRTLADKLTTSITKNKAIVIDYDQDISNLVKVGDVLTFDSTLCLIQEAVTSGLEETDESLLALSKLSNKNPKAKINGKVSKVEVFYMGDYEEASDSLKNLIQEDNKRRSKDVKDLGNGKVGKTGEVRKPVFIAGEKLVRGKVIVSIYIDVGVEAGIGDKSSVANQLKTVHGRIMDGINETEDGMPIDIRFGSSSVMARIVYSVFIQGTLNRVVTEISKSLAEEYLSE